MKKIVEYQIEFKKASNAWIVLWRGTFLFATSGANLGKIDHAETSHLVRALMTLRRRK